jgi:hypothetical protein
MGGCVACREHREGRERALRAANGGALGVEEVRALGVWALERDGAARFWKDRMMAYRARWKEALSAGGTDAGGGGGGDGGGGEAAAGDRGSEVRGGVGVG